MIMKTKELANEISIVLEEKLQHHVPNAKNLKKAIAEESEKLAKKISKLNRKEIIEKQDPADKAVKTFKKGKQIPPKSIPQN